MSNGDCAGEFNILIAKHGDKPMCLDVTPPEELLKQSSMTVAAMSGILIAVIILLIVAVVVAFFFWKKYRKKDPNNHPESGKSDLSEGVALTKCEDKRDSNDFGSREIDPQLEDEEAQEKPMDRRRHASNLSQGSTNPAYYRSISEEETRHQRQSLSINRQIKKSAERDSSV